MVVDGDGMKFKDFIEKSACVSCGFSAFQCCHTKCSLALMLFILCVVLFEKKIVYTGTHEFCISNSMKYYYINGTDFSMIYEFMNAKVFF